MSDRRYEDFEGDTPQFSRIGHDLKLEGILFSGKGEYHLYLLPEGSRKDYYIAEHLDKVFVMTLSTGSWTALLKRSDDPLIYLADSTGTAKAWVRKLQFQISGDVQQRIFARDEFKCMYCGRMMGEVTLSIDHFIPLELDGENNSRNYISSCRRCNKDKGNMSPVEWCEKKKLNYFYYVNYLKEKNK